MSLSPSTSLAALHVRGSTPPSCIEVARGWGGGERVALLAVLALISVPSTVVYYAAPFAALGLLRERRSLSFSLLVFGAMAAWGSIALGVQIALGVEVSLPAALFAVATFSPAWLAPLLLYRMRPMDDASWVWLREVLAWWLLLQAGLGFAAFALSGNPDMVTGSFGFLNFLRGQVTISQVMFTATVFPVALVLLVSSNGTLHRVAALAGLAVAIVAQSGHQTLFLLIAAAVTVPIASGRFRTLIAALALGALTVGAVAAVYPTTYRNAVMWFEKTVQDERSPKRWVFDAMKDKLADPVVFLLGLGPGQFCSRAGLIASGDYISTALPGVLVDASPAFEQDIRPGVDRFRVVGESSAIAQPFSSVMAVPAEFGVPVALAVIAVFVRTYTRMLRLALCSRGRNRNLALVLATVTLAFVLCCTVENYMEFVQGVTVPLILLVALAKRLRLNPSAEGEHP